MEVRGMFFDMSGKIYEVVVDEGRGFVVVVGFGFQPSTGDSSGSGAEVDKQRFLIRFRFAERSVSVFEPVNFHFFVSLKAKIIMARILCTSVYPRHVCKTMNQ